MPNNGSTEKSKLIITPKAPKNPRSKGEDGYKVFSVRVKDETVAELDEIAAKTGRSRNKIIGLLLDYALSNYEISSP